MTKYLFAPKIGAELVISLTLNRRSRKRCVGGGHLKIMRPALDVGPADAFSAVARSQPSRAAPGIKRQRGASARVVTRAGRLDRPPRVANKSCFGPPAPLTVASPAAPKWATNLLEPGRRGELWKEEAQGKLRADEADAIELDSRDPTRASFHPPPSPRPDRQRLFSPTPSLRLALSSGYRGDEAPERHPRQEPQAHRTRRRSPERTPPRVTKEGYDRRATMNRRRKGNSVRPSARLG